MLQVGRERVHEDAGVEVQVLPELRKLVLRGLRHRKVLQSPRLRHGPNRPRRRKLLEVCSGQVVHRRQRLQVHLTPGRVRQVLGQERDRLFGILRVEGSLPDRQRLRPGVLPDVSGSQRSGKSGKDLSGHLQVVADSGPMHQEGSVSLVEDGPRVLRRLLQGRRESDHDDALKASVIVVTSSKRL